MADRSLTLFEIHLHDGFSLSNSAPFVGEVEEPDAETEEATAVEIEGEEAEPGEAEAEAGSGSGAARALLVFALLVGAALAVRRLKGGADEYEELEELDDLAEPEQ
jgi:hypothetical protein